MDWLISREDEYDIISLDWDMIFFLENGITSEENAKFQLALCRFENYENTDCPFCGFEGRNYILKEYYSYKCKKCHKKFSMTSKTYLDSCKLEPFKIWRFAYLVGKLKITNSCVIARDLEVNQCVVFNLLKRLRIARKQNSNKKFKNGHEVLAFNDSVEVLTFLLKKNNNILKLKYL